MKKIGLYFLYSVLIVSSNINAIIFESSDTSDILQHISKDTLVIFDLDDTVFKTPTMLANDAWFDYEIKQRINDGLTFNEATEDVLPTYIVVQLFSDLQACDEKTITLISDLQRQKVAVMALTSRSTIFANRTKEELKRLNVHFSITCPYEHNLNLGISHEAQYTEGILLSGNNHKGKILLQFFEQIRYCPKKIIFLDDKISNLQKVEEIAQQNKIEFVGLRYSGQDCSKKEFDPIKADQLLQDFKIKIGIRPFLKGEKNETRNNQDSTTKH